ncbi:50S ribosomal protein L25 [Candidatus Margulisiibacteriota bacterium]
MVKVELKADKREEKGKKNKMVRAQGLIPAVVYGRKFKATSVSVPLKEFQKKILQSGAGRNLIFTLKLSDDGKAKTIPVITQSVDRDPLTDAILHVDLMHVSMDEAIKTRVRVELVGLPMGVKESEGVLVHGMREIEIKCLPGDIPDKYEVDVSALEINQSLHVSDLKVSKNVEILALPGEMIATVSPPTKEEEVVPAPLTPEEAAAAAAAAEGAEGAEAVAAEGVKEKGAPGAAPGAPGAAGAEKPAAEVKKEKKEKK